MASRRALPSCRRVVYAAVVALALTACGGGGGAEGDDAGGAPTPAPSPAVASAPPAASPTEAAEAPSVPAEGPVVTLITPGDEPRTELRYDIANRHEVDATVRQNQKLSQTINGQPSEVDLTVLFDMIGGVQTTGDTFTMRASLENYRLADDTDPAIADAVGDSLTAFNGLTMVETFDTRGHSLERSIENADEFGDDPTMAGLQSMMEQNAFSNPLPTEPVGPGARWTTVNEIEVQGITVLQTTETELLSIDGNIVELAYTTTQEGPSGAVTLEGVPGDVEIETWDVEGEGTTHVDLTSPIPTTEGRVDMHQKMSSPSDGSTFEQESVTTIELAPNN